ncbi:MAG: NAD(P)H-dependent oxidoreductase subunit E [Gemmatimonadetes bacterium]|nr:MAG: NAD(P)H-dependent oxidoreductase subunit E [Gemmatimonadota bacterium]
MFPNEHIEAQAQQIMAKYPTKLAATLPLAHLAQTELGYLTPEAMEWIAEKTEQHPSHVKNTVSFYTMFYRQPVGKYVIQVCHTLSCALRGARDVTEHIEQKLGIKAGETTQDGKFTLMKVECLAACGTAPMFQINDTYYENLTLDEVDRILDSLE